jgi:hypothetical protein
MIPNLDYIDDISENDTVFRNKLISIIKREFPLERDEFLLNYNTNQYANAAGNVHKLKHKINMFGLKKGFEIAKKFESELNDNKLDSYQDFIVVLNSIDNYLKEI